MQDNRHAPSRPEGATHGAAAPRRTSPAGSGTNVNRAVPATSPARDHILVLGRRGAGKSVFLARLYERLWNSKGDIHMAAVDGQAHVGLLSQIDQMGRRRWPEPTRSFSNQGFDFNYHGERIRLSAPDYSGELLHRAFMNGQRDDPEVRQLLDSIDRAAAVIVLVDPQVAIEGDVETRSEQDFGLVAAVRRIRESPDGDFVPVAITLTKCDLYRDDIESAGGPGKYMRKHYKNLCRAVFRKGSKGTVFACAAVRTRKDDAGKPVPDMARSPRGLVEPLEYCLESLHRHRELAEELRQRGVLAAEASAAAMRSREAEKRATRFSNAVLVGSLVLAAAVIGVLVWVLVGARR